jgi:hypothetical protein
MQVIHVLCPREQVFVLAQEFEERFEEQVTCAVAASGFIAKQPVGFVVLTTVERFDEDFLSHLYDHPDIIGYSTFSLPDDEMFEPFGVELATR